MSIGLTVYTYNLWPLMFELLLRLQLPYSQTLADGNGAAYLLFNRGQQVGGGGISRHVVVVGSSLTTQHLPFLHRAVPWSRHSPCTQEHTTQYYHLYAESLIHYIILLYKIVQNNNVNALPFIKISWTFIFWKIRLLYLLSLSFYKWFLVSIKCCFL